MMLCLFKNVRKHFESAVNQILRYIINNFSKILFYCGLQSVDINKNIYLELQKNSFKRPNFLECDDHLFVQAISVKI